jgi:hypothetical protein
MPMQSSPILLLDKKEEINYFGHMQNFFFAPEITKKIHVENYEEPCQLCLV